MTRLVRIGIHGSNPSLLALSRMEFLQQRLSGIDAQVEWVRLPSGPRSVDFIGADLVDVSGTGSTPPIVAQANGIPLVYVATSQPRSVGGIVVRAADTTRSVAELRGRTIALSAGSWLQHLLAAALDRSALDWREVVPLDLPDAPARAALKRGAIAAWATGDDDADATGELRFIARTGDLVSNPSVFFAHRQFALQQPDLLDAVVQSLDTVDHWIARNPTQAASLLAEAAGAAGREAEWQRAITARPWGLEPITEVFLTEQQEAADLYLRFGLLTRSIDLRAATPERAPVIRRAA